MHTINEYIEQLEKDKSNLVKNLTAMGVPSFSTTDTFTSLAEKVLQVPFMVYEGWDSNLDLSQLNLTREAMVTIFNRLADVKDSFAERTVIVGNDNSVKLQLNDMDIATSKGWKVYFS